MINSKLFIEEEKLSNLTYPKEYQIKGMLEQAEILEKFFPGIAPLNKTQWNLLQQDLPEHAEGWFVLPVWQKIAATYAQALSNVFGAMTFQRRFQVSCGSDFGEDRLRRNPKTAKILQDLAASQDPPFGGDMVVVPCQFGLRHRGRSVRRARAVFAENEFGLGAFEVGCMLLTHPEREVDDRHLHIDCAGDEFSSDGSNQFCDFPVFSFSYDGNLEFDMDWFGRTFQHYGSATGFVA